MITTTDSIKIYVSPVHKKSTYIRDIISGERGLILTLKDIPHWREWAVRCLSYALQEEFVPRDKIKTILRKELRRLYAIQSKLVCQKVS